MKGNMIAMNKTNQVMVCVLRNKQTDSCKGTDHKSTSILIKDTLIVDTTLKILPLDLFYFINDVKIKT